MDCSGRMPTARLHHSLHPSVLHSTRMYVVLFLLRPAAEIFTSSPLEYAAVDATLRLRQYCEQHRSLSLPCGSLRSSHVTGFRQPDVTVVWNRMCHHYERTLFKFSDVLFYRTAFFLSVSPLSTPRFFIMSPLRRSTS